MGILQSAKVKRRTAAPTPGQFGQKTCVVLSHSFATVGFTAATDVLEIGLVPASAQIINVDAIGEGLGAVTADVGVMTGTAGDLDDTRDSGAEFIDDGNVNDATATAAVADCIAVAPSNVDRGLGIKLSGDVAAGAGKKITVVLEYIL